VQQVQFAEPMRAHGGALAADGRTAALDQGDGVVHLVELATGQTRQSFGKPLTAKGTAPGAGTMVAAWLGAYAGAGTVALSPDGRLLAHAGLDNALHVWDMTTGKSLARFEGHQGAIAVIAFSPDGRSVASASHDTTALVWDIRHLAPKAIAAPPPLDAAAVQTRWADLISNKASVAWEAMSALVASPQQTVPFLAKQLPPAVTVDAKRIEQLIAQLDSNEFKVRQQAQTELLKIGDQTVPHLEKVLAGKVTLETRQRLETLHGKLTDTVWTGDRLRIIRAVEVLERIGNIEAGQALESMANGAAGALLTTEARTALDRLK